MKTVTRALVVRSVDYKDSDKILTLLTPDMGKLSAGARGCRKKGSAIAAACQLLCWSELVLSDRGGKWSVSEASTLREFLGVRRDLDKLALACYFAEMAEVLSVEGMPSPGLLSLTLNSLHALECLDRPPEQIKAVFELKAMCLAGYEPLIEGCALCGEENPEQAWFHLREGVLCCARCRESGDGWVPLTPGMLAAMRHVVYGDDKRLFSFRLGGEDLGALSRLTEDYVQTQLERGFGTLDFYHQMKQCAAPCQGYISKEEYALRIDKLLGFLNGDYKKVLAELEQKMKEKAAELEFEEAAEYRDLIESVQHVTGSQRVVKTGGIDRDVIAMARKGLETVVSVFFVRDGKLLGREHFHVEHSEEDTGSQIITAFIKQYYEGTPFVPNELLTEFAVEEHALLEEWLGRRRGGRVHIITPQKGEKSKMIDLARENASVVLSRDLEKIKREEARTVGAANELAQMLGLPSADRLEAFDISNTSGYQSVASMVVFEKGRARKNAYRKFKLRTVSGPDDYKSMEEVLTRRFTDERFDMYPDILMMDGGRGQVNVALKVLDELHLNIPVCGMVKDDNHRTRGLYYNNKEISFPRNSEVFGMITRLQDEAHRFAITYHKQLRGKEQVHSILDDIKGVGPARRKALMQHFKEIGRIKDAAVEELSSVEGVTPQVAEEIYRFFHEEE